MKLILTIRNQEDAAVKVLAAAGKDKLKPNIDFYHLIDGFKASAFKPIVWYIFDTESCMRQKECLCYAKVVAVV